MNAAARALTSIPMLALASLLAAGAGAGAGGGGEGEDRNRRSPQERGLAQLAAGNYAEAAASFRTAIADRGEDAAGRAAAELHYNLGLALWRAGELDEAETAAEKAATLSDGALEALRDGLLGNLRYEAAVRLEAEGQDLQKALDLAVQAEQHYLRGALQPGAPAAVARNLERAQKKIEELKKKIEEQEKQEQEDQENQDQQQDEDGDEQKDENEKKDDQQKQDQQDEPKPSEGDENQEQEKQEPQQEPQPNEGEDQQPPEPQPDEQQQEGEQPDEPKEQKAPAPGEQVEGRELTPEEKKRLLDKLEQFEAELRALRERQKAQRPKVEKDW